MDAAYENVAAEADQVVPVAVGGGNEGFVADEIDDVLAFPAAVEGGNEDFVADADENDDELADAAHELALADDDAVVPVADEASDAAIMEENENDVAAVENDNAGGSSGEEFVSYVNKSVLWDLEAPFLGSNFEKFASAVNDRAVEVAKDVNAFPQFMEYITNVDLMSILSNEEAYARVQARLEFFKQRKVQYQEIKEGMHSASNDFRYCVARLDDEWSKERLDRALVNHLLRMRYIDSAYYFAFKRGIQGLFDFRKFRDADQIVNALRNKDLHPAKAWCDANAPWSKIAMEIFCQEYIESVRMNQKMKALTLAWKHQEELSQFQKSVQQVLAVVAFGRDTSVPRYKKLFDDERWDFLINLFWEQFLKRQRFTNDASSLCILLESGIIVLKDPFCFDGEDCRKDDPLKHEPFRTFASTLPHARRRFPPKLLCHVTKQRLGEQNPPYMLPNGYAYSEQAILGMTNGDEVTCPRTGFVCNARDLRKLELKWY